MLQERKLSDSYKEKRRFYGKSYFRHEHVTGWIYGGINP